MLFSQLQGAINTVFHINFSLILPCVPKKKGLDRQTDGQQSIPIKVLFLLFEV